MLEFRDKYCIDKSIIQHQLFIPGRTYFISQSMIVNLIKPLVIISMFIINLVGFVNVSDYKVYSINASIEIDKLFQNLTPDYLGSKDFNISGEVELLKNMSNLSNPIS